MFENKSNDNSSNEGAEERIGALFQTDTLINDQYRDTYRRQLPLESEQRLVIAVLEDGIHAFQDHFGARNGKKRRLFEEAEAWIFTDQNDWIFSFSSVCAQLNLDPDYLRRGLRQWQARQTEATKSSPAPTTAGLRRRAA